MSDIIKSGIIALGFKPKDGCCNVYFKKFGAYEINIDYNENNPEKSNIDYGKNIKCGRKTTSNFSQNESFVVLECVNRLLEKGYNPNSIVLEQPYKAGHKDCYLDILVKDLDNKSFLMIECKTWGKEYEKEKNQIFKDGGQLLSYFNQDKNSKALCLYASHIENNEISYRNDIIDTKELSGNNVQELFDSWDNTFYQKGIFEKQINAYDYKNIGLIYEDLQDLKDTDGGTIFNHFAEILRKHIVSDKTNAFNKMFNLFICKIQDEDDNYGKDADLKFQFKCNDTYESFFDRLNNLYKRGNKNYIDIDLPDISQDDFDELLKLADEKDEHLRKTFNELRYYRSSQEFSFKEVYNKETFEENAEIVKEIVKLLQGYKIKYSQKHQYLGDFFELLLNTGIKQEAGQFFTPIPLTRFICKSIPIKEIIEDKNNKRDDNFLPYVIDYACGSGHFLTEIMDEIDTYVKDFKSEDIKGSRIAKENFESLRNNLKWSKEYVYGIEKDYRLVKTSKVSSFLNGDGDANVMAADGLAPFNDKKYKGILRTEELQKNNSKFDILVANPPYSISGFRTTLKEGKKCFDLYKRLTDNSSEIECLFVERAIQLLKENGVAGIILPVSILTNGGIYEKTRELILKNFDVVAIQKLGDNAFMATGTKTIILFMRRKSNLAYSNIEKLVDKFLNDFKDVTINGIEHAFSTYVNNVFEDISFEDYISILQDNPTEKARKSEILGEYKDYSIEKILEIEKEKLVYFIISYSQKIILSDSLEKDIEKEFYGYEFSNRKGHEGIHIYKDEDGVLQSKLYNPKNLYDEEKANFYILNNFKGLNSEKIINDIKQSEDHPLRNHIDYINLSDLMSFDLKTFDKQINLNFKKKLKIESKYPLTTLGNVTKNIFIGGTPDRNKREYYQDGNHLWLSIKEMNNNIINDTKEKINDLGVKNSNVKLVKAGTLLFSFKLTIGKTAIAGKDLYTNEAIAALIPNELIKQEYLQIIIANKYVPLEVSSKTFGCTLNSKTIPLIKLPLPPINIQEEIINEIKPLNDILSNNIKSMETKKQIIKDKYAHLHSLSKKYMRLSDKNVFDLSIGKRVLNKQLKQNGNIPVYSANVFKPFGYIDKLLFEDFNRPSVIWGIDGDWLVNTVDKNILFYPTDHCGILRLKKENIFIEKYVAYALQQAGIEYGFSREKRASIDRIKTIKIPVPDYNIQKNIVAELVPLENEIEKLQKEIDSIPTKKQAILDKYLK